MPFYSLNLGMNDSTISRGQPWHECSQCHGRTMKGTVPIPWKIHEMNVRNSMKQVAKFMSVLCKNTLKRGSSRFFHFEILTRDKVTSQNSFRSNLNNWIIVYMWELGSIILESSIEKLVSCGKLFWNCCEGWFFTKI